MTLVTANDISIWYEETGAGEPMVQIHGSGFGHLNFAAATPHLSRHFHVVDFDLRGYGQSDQPIQHCDMEVWADETAGLMDALSIPKAHIHGTSMGAPDPQLWCRQARLGRHPYPQESELDAA